MKFFGVNDYIKYKVIVDNPTNKDYEITSDSDLNLGEYISYDYNYENSSNIIKKNSQMTMYINIKYNKEVPSNLFRNGVFNERNNITIDLGNNDRSSIVNPKTGNYLLVFIIMLIIIGVSIVVFSSFKNKKYYCLVIISLLLPISIYAIEKIQINIDSNVIISSNPKFCYTYEGKKYYFEYEDGMTWGEYMNSDFNKGYFEIIDNSKLLVKRFTNISICPFINIIDNNSDINNTECYVVQLNGCK